MVLFPDRDDCRVVLLLLAGFVHIPYLAIYPENQAYDYDFGTKRQQEVMRRFRRYVARVPFWRRCLRVVTFPCRRKPSRRNIIKAYRQNKNGLFADDESD
jgi:hypothetical protein